MQEGGAVHKFPSAPSLAAATPETASFTTFDPEQRANLLASARDIKKRADSLVEFVDTQRDVAKQVGIETIGVEMATILEAGRLDAVIDTLEEAAQREQPGHVSTQGLDALRRTELLLADALRNIDRYAPTLDTASMAGQRETVLVGERGQTVIHLANPTPPAQQGIDMTFLLGLVVVTGLTFGCIYLLTKSR